MKISVIGCGRWGTFIAWYLDKIGLNVELYGRGSSKNMAELLSKRCNEILTLSDKIILSTDINSVKNSDIIVISINSQGLRSLLAELKMLNLTNKTFVLCMKGLEVETGERLSQICEQAIDSSCKVAVWLGPGHVQEFCRGIPNCMIIDSDDIMTKENLVSLFSSELIRFYYGQDLIGNEVGAASKNVIGIAAGMLDGLKLTSLKGALMSRGTREIARLISAMGGNELSAYGLCHLGDYEATVFSEFSHNRKYGEMFIKGEQFESLAEGYYTVKALVYLGNRYCVDLPICNAVYKVLYEGNNPKDTLKGLFIRAIKKEF